MKTFIILLLLAALGLLGSAFFGVYTAPGLEGIPTVQSIGIQRRAAQTERAQEIYNGTSKQTTPFRANANGKTAERNRYLEQQQKVVAPGRQPE